MPFLLYCCRPEVGCFLVNLCVCSSVVERCPDKTEAESSILSTRTMRGIPAAAVMQTIKPYYRDALMAFGRMSGWVAGPVVLALVLGKWLDRKYDTAPYLFIAIIGLGFFISLFGIFRESRRYLKQAALKEAELKVGAPVDTETQK